MDAQAAAVLLQKNLRGFQQRLRIQKVLRTEFVKFFDDETGTPYYYRLSTGESQWTRPTLLLGPDLPLEEDVDRWAHREGEVLLFITFSRLLNSDTLGVDYSFIDAIVDENGNSDNFQTGGEVYWYEPDHDSPDGHERFGDGHFGSSFDLDSIHDQDASRVAGNVEDPSLDDRTEDKSTLHGAPSASDEADFELDSRSQRKMSVRALDPREFLKGPFCSRGGPGRQVKRAIRNVFILPYNQKKSIAARRPGNIDPAAVELEEDVPFFDGLNIKEIPVDEYAMTRAAAERNPLHVIKIMSKYIRKPSVVRYGLRQLAALDFEETETGDASKLTKKSIKLAFTVMEQFTRDTGMQAGCLEVLNSIASRYVNRTAILENKWTDAFEWSLRSCTKATVEVMAQVGDDLAKVLVEEPTTDSLSICHSICSILAQLAYDIRSRLTVAQSGIDIVLRVLDFVDCCDAMATLAACKALYNFVYRCEEAHYEAGEKRCLEVVQKILENLGSDDDVVLFAHRAKAALEPNGWRGDVELQDNSGSPL